VRRRIAALVWLSVLGLAGCRLDLAVDVAVDRDGGGTLAVALGAAAVLLDEAAAAVADALADLAAAGQALRGDGWRTTDRTDDEGSRRVTLTTAFAGPDELARLSTELADALNAPEAWLLDPLVLTVTDDHVRLDGAAGLVPERGVADLGVSPEEAIRLATEAAAVTYRVRAAMPGEVVEATTDTRDGRLLVWDVAPGERVALVAVGERPPSRLWALTGGGLVALALIAAALWLRRRSGATNPAPP
jgi:hypothetical protein